MDAFLIYGSLLSFIATGGEKLSASNVTPRQLPRAAWIWNTSTQPKQIQNYSVQKVFVSIPMVRDQNQLSTRQIEAFVKRVKLFSKHGMQVWIVEGDPLFVTDAGQRNMLAHIHALKSLFRACASEGVPLQGLQLDIEPWVLPGWTVAQFYHTKRWQNSVALVKEQWPYVLDVVVPWWIETSVINAMDVSQFTVMNYQNDLWRMGQTARRFVSWAQKSNRKISIGLEFGLTDVESAKSSMNHLNDLSRKQILQELELSLGRFPSFLGLVLHGIED